MKTIKIEASFNIIIYREAKFEVVYIWKAFRAT